MKRKRVFLSNKNFSLLFIALLFSGITACEKTTGEGDLSGEGDSSGEISPDSKSQILENEVNGIAFKFCLLNEQGQQDTVFKEGENFSFYFSVTNKTNENLHFFPDFAYTNINENKFCEVFTSDSQSIGRPFVFRGYDKIGIGAYPLNSEENYVFEQSWIDSRDSVWRREYGYYESSHQTPLPAGDYFTGFQSRFQFYDCYLDTTLTFNINFKIKQK